MWRQVAAVGVALLLGAAGAYVFVTAEAGIGMLLIGSALFIGLAGGGSSAR